MGLLLLFNAPAEDPYVTPDVVSIPAELVRRRVRVSGFRYFLGNSADMEIIGEMRCHNRRLSVDNNRSGSTSFWCSLEDDVMAHARPWKSCVIVQRDDEWIWSGPVQTRNASLAAGRVDISASGWFERLMHRLLFTAPAAFTNVDAGVIAFTLLEAANAVNDSFIVPGTWQPSQLRTRTYVEDIVVGQEIQQLADIESGYDWYVDPMTRELNVVARRGNVLPDVQWIFIDPVSDTDKAMGNLEDVQVLEDGTTMVNDQMVRGQISSAEAISAESIFEFGALDDVKSLSDVVDPDILNAYANGEIVYRDEPHQTYTILPKSSLAVNVPRFKIDFDLGDTTFLTAERGYVNVQDQAVRVFGLDLDIDDYGVDKITRLQTALA